MHFQAHVIAAELKNRARSLGFSHVGIVRAVPARRLDAYLSWIERAFHGTMGYMARPDRVARRRDLDIILPGVQSIICVAMDYSLHGPPLELLTDASRGRISNYAWGVDYHEAMTPRLEALGEWLRSMIGSGVADRVYVDTGAILERDHAESAGLGFTGKNTMLIGPRRGSWFFLGELLTTAALPPDEPRQMPGCGSCTRCLTACPTAAFPQPYVLDARRCISYLTIELKERIPRDLRPLLGNWVYGCDICQDVCPFNRFAPAGAPSIYRPETIDSVVPALLDLLALSDADFERRFARSPIRRIKRARLIRNAAVAAGNWGHPQAIPALARLLHDPSPLIREHAAWALGQISTQSARAALKAALETETNEWVRRELAA